MPQIAPKIFQGVHALPSALAQLQPQHQCMQPHLLAPTPLQPKRPDRLMDFLPYSVLFGVIWCYLVLIFIWLWGLCSPADALTWTSSASLTPRAFAAST